MIKNGRKLEEFNRKLIAREKIPHAKALRIFEAMLAEAVHLGAINSENILEGIETDIRIAKALNGLKKQCSKS